MEIGAATFEDHLAIRTEDEDVDIALVINCTKILTRSDECGFLLQYHYKWSQCISVEEMQILYGIFLQRNF